ncbi:MAG: ATP-binding cassette domain-containing protein, partial [candidate division WOR-3 bacterium]
MQEKITLRSLRVWAAGREVLKNVNLSIPANQIMSIIGPAHSGKTTLLRTINRLLELDPAFRRQGDVLLDGIEVRQLDPNMLRRRVGLIFATPVPLPGTIFDNVAYGPRLHGIPRRRIAETVERSLRAAFLWDEVKDRLHTSALPLPGGQHQRLSIARPLATPPALTPLPEP